MVLWRPQQLIALNDSPHPGGPQPGLGEVVDAGTEDDRRHTGVSQALNGVVGGPMSEVNQRKPDGAGCDRLGDR